MLWWIQVSALVIGYGMYVMFVIASVARRARTRAVAITSHADERARVLAGERA